MIDFTPILEALIALLATLITVKLVPWIKARTTNEQQVKLEAAVRTAVFAAEQVYGAGNGREKLRYAQSYLYKRGFSVDVEDIEAAVKMYFGKLDLIDDAASVEEEAGDAPEEPP